MAYKKAATKKEPEGRKRNGYAANWAICSRELRYAELGIYTERIDYKVLQEGKLWHTWLSKQPFTKGWYFYAERGEYIALPQGGQGTPDAIDATGIVIEFKSMSANTYDKTNSIVDLIEGAHYIRAYLFQLCSYALSLSKPGRFLLLKKPEGGTGPQPDGEYEMKTIDVSLEQAKTYHAQYVMWRTSVLKQREPADPGCKYCNFQQACDLEDFFAAQDANAEELFEQQGGK